MSTTPTLEELRRAEAYNSGTDYSQARLEEFERTFNWLFDNWNAYDEATSPRDAAEWNQANPDLQIDQADYDFIFSPAIDFINDSLNDVLSRLPPIEEGAPARVSPRPASTRVSPTARRSESSASASPTGGRTGRSRTASLTRPAGRSGSATPPRTPSPPRRPGARAGRTTRGAATVERTAKKKTRGKSPVPVVTNTGHGQAEQLTRKGVKEANYWHFKVPGSTWEADILTGSGVDITGLTQDQIHDQAVQGLTRKQIEKAKRDAVVNDLVRYKDNFLVGKVNRLPWGIHINGKTILELHDAIVTLQGVIAKYGNAKLRVTSSDRVSITIDPVKDSEYLERVLQQRIRIYDYYVRALRTRRPIVAAPLTSFSGQNTRILLVPEAVAWVNSEDFTVSNNLAPVLQVEQQDGRTENVPYNNLWDYIEAITGKTKEQTYLYRGMVTKGNYQSLIRLLPKKIDVPAPAKEQKKKLKRGEKRPKKEPQPRRKPKYEYTQAMLDTFGALQATLDVTSKTDSTKVNNTSGKSVLKLLSDRLGAGVFSEEELINTGIMPLFVNTYYPAATASETDEAFFGKYNDPELRNKAQLDTFIEETNAIRSFLDSVSESRTLGQEADKEREKEDKKQAALEARRDAARARTGARRRVQ